MKRISIMMLAALFFIAGCRKTQTDSTDFTRKQIEQSLRERMRAEDFAALDFSTLQVNAVPGTKERLARVGFMGKQFLQESVVLRMSEGGEIKEGYILQVHGKISGRFSGSISVRGLNGETKISSTIENGFILESHRQTVSVNSVRVNQECADCTLPEVIVSSSSSGSSYDWSAVWLSLQWLFNDWPPMDYIPVDYISGGGGGGGSAPAPVITIDYEAPENKDKIDQKKYTDCFGTIPDGSTTLYTITISTDLPTDGHPEIFYNWKDGSPGHAFIELNKSTPYGGVTQNFGFYPTSSYKLITLDNSVYLPSKIVDDGGHEYQARYTVSLTAAQFQAAVNAVNSPRDQYNVGFYNCTDFALDVFNAAGGNLSIPKHAIPGFEVGGGSNTPQGLYEKIQSMKSNGTAGATTTNGKEYGSNSKGPCN